MVIFCCVTKYHKLSTLKHHPFIMSQFSRSEVQVGLLNSQLKLWKAKIKVLARLDSCLKALGKNLLPDYTTLLVKFSSLWLQD